MRKNKMMRTASALLVATLLTSSVTSGTFAKYVTQDNATDTARVAKWGVVAAVSGDLFGATYKEAADNSIISYDVNGGTVSSSDAAFVVAPGTKNDTGMTLYVVGTPEVSTKAVFDAAENASGVDYADSEISLQAGTYGVMVKYNGVVTNENYTKYYEKDGDTYKVATSATLGADKYYELHDDVAAADKYLPMNWYVNGTKVADVAAVKSTLKTSFDTKFPTNHTPNTDLAWNAKVTWDWNYGTANDGIINDENIENTDKMDTILGNMIAEQMVPTDAYDVVCANATGFDVVKYATVNADLSGATGTYANDVVVAYTGDTYSKDKIVACLTVAFNARITVEQVD